MKKLPNKSIKVKVNHYKFDLEIPEERKQYKELHNKLKSKGLRVFDCWSEFKDYEATINAQEFILDTSHIFENQWNTTEDSPNSPNVRVFDWREFNYYNNKHLKPGYWIELTDEAKAIRENTLHCGYCGNYEPKESGLKFCNECLKSSYLSEDDLKLLKLYPVSQRFKTGYPELNEKEKAEIMPKYIEQQTKLQAETDEKLRKQLKENYEKAVNKTDTEYNGFIWLLDNNINTDNCIYYSHRNVFCFGWRSQLSDSVKESLTKQLKEFPFDWEFSKK